MARRAASIWRAVKRPRATALRPNSPKLTLLPRVAMPVLRPFCSLRYFLLDGCSMFHSRLSYSFFRFGRSWRRRLFHSGVLTLVYPNLDANNTVSGFCLGGTIVDIGT